MVLYQIPFSQDLKNSFQRKWNLPLSLGFRLALLKIGLAVFILLLLHFPVSQTQSVLEQVVVAVEFPIFIRDFRSEEIE